MKKITKEMDELLANSSKKSSSALKKEDKIKYQNAFEQILSADGFSKETQKYFYDGFNFLGPELLVQWSEKKDGAIKSLEEFFNSYKEDDERKINISSQCLSSLFNKKSEDKAFIKLLIKILSNIPRREKNQVPSNYFDIIRKNFINLLDETARFEPLAQLSFNDVEQGKFRNIFDQLFSNSKQKKEIEQKGKQKIVQLVQEWLKPPLVTAKKTSQLKEVLNAEQLKEEKTALEFDIKKLKKEIEGFQQENKILREESASLNSKNNELEEKLKETRERVSQYLEENKVLQNENLEKEKALERYKELADALRVDREKGSNNQLDRIASQLKMLYKDFKDAEVVQMNEDLGEVFRDHLKKVFKVMKDEGVSLD